MQLAHQTSEIKNFEQLVEHPEIRVVDCYFHLEGLQFHTLWFITEKLLSLGFTREEISKAMKLYMEG